MWTMWQECDANSAGGVRPSYASMARRGSRQESHSRRVRIHRVASGVGDWSRTFLGPVETGEAMSWVRSLTPDCHMTGLDATNQHLAETRGAPWKRMAFDGDGRATAADGCGDDGGDDDMRAPERRVPCGGAFALSIDNISAARQSP